MTDETPQKIHLGKGILKPGTRPMKVHVDENGEWWICDADVDPSDKDFREKGCTDYSSMHNK
jgi:hypothetical protein